MAVLASLREISGRSSEEERKIRSERRRNQKAENMRKSESMVLKWQLKMAFRK